MPAIELNTTHTNKVTICFESKILLDFIGIIQIDIPICITKFYVIDTLTLI